MSEAKHTPGPWHTRASAFSDGGLYIERSEIPIASIAGDKIADIPGVQTEREANARLIAAAPELLEAVIAYRLHHKLMLNVVDDTDCPCKICQMAEAALRKAKGETR